MPTELTVTGMTCQGCEEVVETAIANADGVDGVDADRYDDVAVVEGDVDVEEVAEKVEMAGYEPHP